MRHLVLALLLCGCGTTAATVERTVPTAGPDRLIVDVATGEVLARETAVSRLLAARHVYVGETHGSDYHHKVQLEVLRTMQLAGADLAVGIEWLPAAVQPAIDAWFSGRIDEQQFLKQADWKHNWGHHYDKYGPILRWARQQGVPVWALNVENAVPKAVASHGPKYVNSKIKPKLPPLDTANDAHRAFFKAMMERVKHGHRGRKHKHEHRGHHKGHKHKHSHPLLPKMERYYLAQLVRDETMARNLSQRLKGAPARTAVVLAGLGHIDPGYGVPSRARKLLDADFVIVLPVQHDKIGDHGLLLGKTRYPKKRADLLWEAPVSGGLSARYHVGLDRSDGLPVRAGVSDGRSRRSEPVGNTGSTDR